MAHLYAKYAADKVGKARAKKYQYGGSVTSQREALGAQMEPSTMPIPRNPLTDVPPSKVRPSQKLRD